MHCPSYTTGCKIKNMPENIVHLIEGLENTDDFEALYCAYSKSRCITEDKGCRCEDCEVHKQYKLNRDEYCLKDGGL